MKILIYILFIILLPESVISCKVANAGKQQVQREWMLVSFGTFSKEELTKSKAAINLTAPEKNGKIHGGAFMGCNRMFFTAEFGSGNKLTISDVGGTMMACSNMQLETSFAAFFKKMNRYRTEGQYLILSDENGDSMKFIAADWD
ncbi:MULTISPECIES: META domain-containing protein [Chryseobacterium]|uniref:Heat shock protein HslJ n=1 Tax=Chryseobacterium camelliae TaxID=1265445 RepID=A0ABU0TM43_9FLAO|nr:MULTISPECIES: META domain-containing protein [Chryseobacterium]MDT3408030.1 heat shock protein HslJ [Pseudacidovorax intermedius]MDQ1098115.1 heat shock protein HslJ [Chryseobacterium camelliae]MDQ1102045.1 heat shock protein HslJ [Chryseobacterium sp. SORGH_AS_1048]MDR6085481.1 heat shock protein HslJ [Chryseobacterium sp. SORGH_AS_0909]MDR6129845.1 heat shock protein HslJ [Chryseobacterium sp. SORGH_AS_1175]